MTFLTILCLPIIVILVLRVLGLTNSKKKNFTAATAPLGSRVSRIAESIILMCIASAIFIFTATNTSTNGSLLNLGELPKTLGQIHITAACIVLALLIVSLLITCFWRSGVGIALAAIVMITYGLFLNGGLMEMFFREEIFTPKVMYTFKMSDKFAGGEELWINNVYLGKMPLMITGDDFCKKVPFMAEPPEGYKDNNRNQPAGSWFQFQLLTLEKKGDTHHSYYGNEFKGYYAKIKFEGQYAENGYGIGGGGGSQWSLAYEHSFGGSFPDRNKLIEEENKRFDTLIQKARLNQYTIDSEWWQAFSTFGEGSIRTLRKLAKDEPGFERVMNTAARLKYGFPETVDTQTAQKVFERICREADVSMQYDSGGIEGCALKLICDKLDVNRLVADYRKALKSGRELHVSASWGNDNDGRDYMTYYHDPKKSYARNKPLPASVSVICHAIRLWDKKLNTEHPGQDNIIETEITPLYIAYRNDLDTAADLGGTIFEEYLLRQYHRRPQIEGMDMGYDNFKWQDGQFLNKWLCYLVELDTPAGKEFRKMHSDETMKLTRLLSNNRFNHEKRLPDFLFYDLHEGQSSLAVRFWPEYSASIDTSSPPWEESKLEKRFEYLARMGNLATDEMVEDCLKKVNFDKINTSGQMVRAIQQIPRQKRFVLAQYILKGLKKRQDQIRSNQDWVVQEFESYLICLGDEESIKAFLATKPEQKQNRLQQIQSIINNYAFRSDRWNIAACLAGQDSADLKKLSIRYLQETLTPENVGLLKTLSQDSDAAVKQAAEKALNELEAIKQIPYGGLVSLESTYVPPR